MSRRTARILFLSLSLGFLTRNVAAQQTAPGKPPATPAQWTGFVQAFDAYSDSDRIVGASVALLHDGRVVAHHEHGLADRAAGQPITERSIFHYASITKTLTANLAADRSHNYYARKDSATGRDTVIDNGADCDPGITIPNGGWNAPLSDVAKYLAFLTNSTHGDAALRARYETVLPHRDFAEMWKPYLTMPPEAQPMFAKALAAGNTLEMTGLSFFGVRRGTGTFIGHTGGQAGFASFIYLNPVTSDAIVVAFNTEKESGSGSSRRSFSEIRDRALDLIK